MTERALITIPISDRVAPRPARRAASPPRNDLPLIVGLSGPGFGDVFKLVQYGCHLRSARCRAAIYPLWHGYEGADFREEPLCSREELARELMGVLEVDEPLGLVTRVADLGQVTFPWSFEPWHFPYTPTRMRWRPLSGGRHGRVTCQLDGIWNEGAKNPPREDIARLHACFPSGRVAVLGKHLSVQQCVEALASSDLFFGVDSGMLQLAYSVGTPAFLITYRQDRHALRCWHGDKHAVWCSDTDDFIAKARAFLGMR